MRKHPLEVLQCAVKMGGLQADWSDDNWEQLKVCGGVEVVAVVVVVEVVEVEAEEAMEFQEHDFGMYICIFAGLCQGKKTEEDEPVRMLQ